jgi:hypothetical protein
MNVVLWIAAAVLAVAFIGAGAMKLSQPKTALAARGMGWVDHASAGQVKAIGALEVVGGIGLVLPALVGVGAHLLVPLAATGLALVMVGAVATHVRLNEAKASAPALVLLLLSAFVAVGRFSIHPFS